MRLEGPNKITSTRSRVAGGSAFLYWRGLCSNNCPRWHDILWTWFQLSCRTCFSHLIGSRVRTMRTFKSKKSMARSTEHEGDEERQVWHCGLSMLPCPLLVRPEVLVQTKDLFQRDHNNGKTWTWEIHLWQLRRGDIIRQKKWICCSRQ